MIKVFKCIGILLLFASAIRGQQSAKLIVRGDDMGYSHSGNLALIKSAIEGFQTSIEVIVPSPWFPEAVKLLKQHPQLDVGIHLALTSEWDNVKWRPLTAGKSFCDSNGYFLPMAFPNKNYAGLSLKEKNIDINEVEKEFRAQIETAKKYIPGISHISSHMGCTYLSPEIQALTKKLAKEYNIDIDPADYKVVSMGYGGGQTKTSAQKVESFINALNKLEAGKTYLFVDHPGLDDAELRAVSHIGYENVAEDRQGVTDLFTSEKVKAVIRERNIQLISYRDLQYGK